MTDQGREKQMRLFLQLGRFLDEQDTRLAVAFRVEAKCQLEMLAKSLLNLTRELVNGSEDSVTWKKPAGFVGTGNRICNNPQIYLIAPIEK